MHLGPRLRMLACQSAERMAAVSVRDHETLFRRTVLQAFLEAHRDRVPASAWSDSGDVTVGRIKNASTWPAYARKACARIGFDLQDMRDGELEAFFSMHAWQLRPFQCFVRLRTALAQVVESIIVLDRKVFLDEV